MTNSIHLRNDIQVSIIIPTYNSEATLEECLTSTRREFPTPHEVIVVDDIRTTDRTRELALMYDAQVVVSPAGMAESRNVGAKLCSGDFILHLDSDMALPAGLREAILHELEMSGADALVIPECSIGEGKWLRARQIDKDVVRELRVGESVRLVRKRLMEELGGYDVTLLAGEDADFDRRVRASGAKTSRLEDPAIIHNDGRITLIGVARKKYRYGKTLKAYEIRNGGLYSWVEMYGRVKGGAVLAIREDFSTAVRYLVLKGVEFGFGGLGRLSSRLSRSPRVAGEVSEADFTVSLASVIGVTQTGGDVFILRLIRALRARGYSLRVVTTQDQLDQAEWVNALGSETHVEIVGPRRHGNGRLLTYLSIAMRVLTGRRTRGSVLKQLVIGSPFLPDLAMLLVNRKASQVFVAWQLDIPQPLGKIMRLQTTGMRLTERVATVAGTAFSYLSQVAILRLAATRSYYVIVTNESLAAACATKGISPDRIITASYGVDLQPAPSFGFDDRLIDFLFLGRLHSQKGFVDVLAAWRLISVELPFTRLTVVGDDVGLFADWCKREIAMFGTSIDYKGSLEGDAKWSVLRATRVLLFPSTYESFGIVAVEGMAAGAAVVGYDIEVTRRAFGDAIWRVPVGDVQALASAAVTCFTNQDAWELQHKRSLAVAAKYDWDAAADSLAERIVKRSPGDSPGPFNVS
jgi:glycosyltransferase involved in cell wall biosynthesis